jgi:hypothetical protein
MIAHEQFSRQLAQPPFHFQTWQGYADSRVEQVAAANDLVN